MNHVYNLNIDRLNQNKLVFHEKVKHLNNPNKRTPKPKPKPIPNKPTPPPAPTPNLPSLINLRSSPNMPPIYDQGQLGSCTANALCAAYEFDSPGFMGSRLFLYYNERIITHNISIDSGSSLSAGITCLNISGLCPETEWPYNISKFATQPPQSCYTDALIYTATRDTNVQTTMEAMQTILASGLPFVIGIAVYSSFESTAVASNGIVPMPTAKDRLLGGHAVMVCGYDNTHNWWIVRNSWGTSWGDGGYFYLPYQYLINTSLSSDAWCIETVSLAPHAYNVNLQSMPTDSSLYTTLSYSTSPPQTVDFRKLYPAKMTPVYNQGNLGSCTANALCAAYSFDSPTHYLGSRVFLYYNERLNEGDRTSSNGSITLDNGSTIINGIQCLQKYGLCLESLLPYNAANYSLKPNSTCYSTGLKYKCINYTAVLQSLSLLQGCLISGLPIVLGFKVYSSFESRSSLLTGYVPMPYISSRGSDTLLGGHAVLLCGYDMTKTYPANPLNPTACPGGTGVWIIKNSWGTSVGESGYFYLPLPYLTNPSLAIEFWCLQTVTA